MFYEDDSWYKWFVNHVLRITGSIEKGRDPLKTMDSKSKLLYPLCICICSTGNIKLTRSSRSAYKIINSHLLFGHQQKNGEKTNLSSIAFWHYIFFNVHFNIISSLKITAVLQIGNLPSAPLHCIKTSF